MNSRILGLFTMFLVFGVSSVARADDSPEPDAAVKPSGAPYDQAIVGDFGLGVVSSRGSDFEGALTVEGAVIKRLGFFELGGRAELGTAVLANHRLGLGGLAGVGFHRARIGVALLAEGGFHTYAGVGSRATDVFDHTDGAGGTVPYFGLRLALDVPLESAAAARSGHRRGFVGLALSVRREPWQSQQAYSFRAGSLFGDDDPTFQNAEASLGGATEMGLALRIGFDVAR